MTAYEYLKHLRARNIEPVIINNKLGFRSAQPIPKSILNACRAGKNDLLREMEIESWNSGDKAQWLRIAWYHNGGYAIIYCEKVTGCAGEPIVFIRDDEARRKIPVRYRGLSNLVFYTLTELQEIAQQKPSLEQMKTIHAAKRLFEGATV